jgi:hypothetical protein
MCLGFDRFRRTRWRAHIRTHENASYRSQVSGLFRPATWDVKDVRDVKDVIDVRRYFRSSLSCACGAPCDSQKCASAEGALQTSPGRKPRETRSTREGVLKGRSRWNLMPKLLRPFRACCVFYPVTQGSASLHPGLRCFAPSALQISSQFAIIFGTVSNVLMVHPMLHEKAAISQRMFNPER